jgi:hypothetical protein
MPLWEIELPDLADLAELFEGQRDLWAQPYGAGGHGQMGRAVAGQVSPRPAPVDVTAIPPTVRGHGLGQATLLEWARRLDPDGRVPAIVNLLEAQPNPWPDLVALHKADKVQQREQRRLEAVARKRVASQGRARKRELRRLERLLRKQIALDERQRKAELRRQAKLRKDPVFQKLEAQAARARQRFTKE